MLALVVVLDFLLAIISLNIAALLLTLFSPCASLCLFYADLMLWHFLATTFEKDF